MRPTKVTRKKRSANLLRFNVKHDTEGMSKSVHKSRRSSKTGKSSYFSSSSVREK